MRNFSFKLFVLGSLCLNTSATMEDGKVVGKENVSFDYGSNRFSSYAGCGYALELQPVEDVFGSLNPVQEFFLENFIADSNLPGQMCFNKLDNSLVYNIGGKVFVNFYGIDQLQNRFQVSGAEEKEDLLKFFAGISMLKTEILPKICICVSFLNSSIGASELFKFPMELMNDLYMFGGLDYVFDRMKMYGISKIILDNFVANIANRITSCVDYDKLGDFAVETLAVVIEESKNVFKQHIIEKFRNDFSGYFSQWDISKIFENEKIIENTEKCLELTNILFDISQRISKHNIDISKPYSVVVKDMDDLIARLISIKDVPAINLPNGHDFVPEKCYSVNDLLLSPEANEKLRKKPYKKCAYNSGKLVQVEDYLDPESFVKYCEERAKFLGHFPEELADLYQASKQTLETIVPRKPRIEDSIDFADFEKFCEEKARIQGIPRESLDLSQASNEYLEKFRASNEVVETANQRKGLKLAVGSDTPHVEADQLDPIAVHSAPSEAGQHIQSNPEVVKLATKDSAIKDESSLCPRHDSKVVCPEVNDQKMKKALLKAKNMASKSNFLPAVNCFVNWDNLNEVERKNLLKKYFDKYAINVSSIDFIVVVSKYKLFEETVENLSGNELTKFKDLILIAHSKSDYFWWMINCINDENPYGINIMVGDKNSKKGKDCVTKGVKVMNLQEFENWVLNDLDGWQF